jgi:hypothetical protein
MRKKFSRALPLPVRNALRKLGRDIRDARLRRRLATVIMANRALIDRKTPRKIENGDAGVSAGAYATILFILGMTDRFADEAWFDWYGKITNGKKVSCLCRSWRDFCPGGRPLTEVFVCNPRKNALTRFPYGCEDFAVRGKLWVWLGRKSISDELQSHAQKLLLRDTGPPRRKKAAHNQKDSPKQVELEPKFNAFLEAPNSQVRWLRSTSRRKRAILESSNGLALLLWSRSAHFAAGNSRSR